jgi:hypothetical protein
MDWAFNGEEFQHSADYSAAQDRYFSQGGQFDRDAAVLEAQENTRNHNNLHDQIIQAIGGVRERVEAVAAPPVTCWTWAGRIGGYMGALSASAGVYFYHDTIGKMVEDEGGKGEIATDAAKYTSLAALTFFTAVAPVAYAIYKAKVSCCPTNNNQRAAEEGRATVAINPLFSLPRNNHPLPLTSPLAQASISASANATPHRAHERPLASAPSPSSIPAECLTSVSVCPKTSISRDNNSSENSLESIDSGAIAGSEGSNSSRSRSPTPTPARS